MYKLLALDLDGTLIGKELTISSKTKNAIAQLMSRGVTVTIATGRMFQSARPFAKELNISTPLICYQGAMVGNPVTGEILSHLPIPLPLAKQAIEAVRKEGLHINAYLDDQLYVDHLNEHAELYSVISKVEAHPVGDLMTFLDRDPTKLVIIGKPSEIDQITSKLSDQFISMLYVAKSYARFCEIAHPDCGKGRALSILADQLGIDQAEVIAIGDNPNDVDMLEWAGMGIAMANGTDEAKGAANWITGSISEDGVAQAIEKFF
ncbi:MAG: HAD family phosphatase [Chloroflexi bacterium]|jgi:Cof subfamily protein (haloacid dehalogenase superfamily)|nr:HAD family phosphatase [Chloroflexota bacterium]MBT7081763.1 HAD family phosphatase [Chloroflexota bacterium]MBT7289403.1 HAD family phosphatase [Chloroflexota bacterium]